MDINLGGGVLHPISPHCRCGLCQFALWPAPKVAIAAVMDALASCKVLVGFLYVSTGQ